MDQRGAVAFEMPFILGFILLALLFPLADVAVLGFQYISAQQALRDFGQYALYHVPSDIGAPSWPAGATTISGYSISNIQVICGDPGSACTTNSTTIPKYYKFQTSFSFTPLVLGPVMGCTGQCSYTLTYSERFQ
jgi:hypothetical protein